MNLVICPICMEVFEYDVEGRLVTCDYCHAGFVTAISKPGAPGPEVLKNFTLPSVNLFSEGCETFTRNTFKAFELAGVEPDVGALLRFIYSVPERESDFAWARGYQYQLLEAAERTKSAESVLFYFCTQYYVPHPRVRSMITGALTGVLRALHSLEARGRDSHNSEAASSPSHDDESQCEGGGDWGGGGDDGGDW